MTTTPSLPERYRDWADAAESWDSPPWWLGRSDTEAAIDVAREVAKSLSQGEPETLLRTSLPCPNGCGESMIAVLTVLDHRDGLVPSLVRADEHRCSIPAREPQRFASVVRLNEREGSLTHYSLWTRTSDTDLPWLSDSGQRSTFDDLCRRGPVRVMSWGADA